MKVHAFQAVFNRAGLITGLAVAVRGRKAGEWRWKAQIDIKSWPASDMAKWCDKHECQMIPIRENLAEIAGACQPGDAYAVAAIVSLAGHYGLTTKELAAILAPLEA